MLLVRDVGVVGQVAGSSAEGLDDLGVVEEDFAGGWRVRLRLLLVMCVVVVVVKDIQPISTILFNRILRGTFSRHSSFHTFNQKPCSLLRNHPIIPFDGRFRQVIIIQLYKATRIHESMSTHGSATRFNTVGCEFRTETFQSRRLSV